MILPKFELYRPRSVDEALGIARGLPGDFDYVAGGTDLLQNYKNRLNAKPHVISLTDIEEMKTVTPDRIGGLVRLSDLEGHPLIRERYPAIAQAASQVASPLVRESATVGGNILVETRCFYFNQTFFWRQAKGFCLKADGDVCLVVPQKEICYATYSGDIAPVLLVLDASFVLRGLEGDRTIRAREFFQPDGIRKHVMKKGEIITHIEIPEESADLRAAYQKLRLRDSFDYPVLGVAAAVRRQNGTVDDMSIVVNAVSWTPLLFDEVTKGARGESLTDELIDQISADIQDRCQPVKNTYLSPPYRKKMIGVYVKRVLREIAGG
ncbi:MAG: FAD binding domain-containing protein [Planctomycetota bacterium]|nr:FAD binding domain-containing protein [Planctomycetota bacterium]